MIDSHFSSRLSPDIWNMRAARGWARRSVMVLLAMAMVALLALPQVNAGPTPTTASLSGVVFGTGGLPAGRAKVTAYALPGFRPGCESAPDEWAAVATATTRSNGSYRFSGLIPGHYRIGVVPRSTSIDSFGYRLKDGNVTSWIGYADDVVVPGPAADVHLAAPATVAGAITDKETGVGIPGIEVRFVSMGPWQRQYPFAVTDATGAYRMQGLPLGVPDPIPGTPENEAQRFGPALVDPKGWYGVYLWWFETLGGGPDRTVDLDTPGPYGYDHALDRGGRLTLAVMDPAGRRIRGLAVTTDSAFPWPTQFTDSRGRVYLGLGGGGPEQTNDIAVQVTDYAGRYRTTWSGGSPTVATAQRIPVVADQDNFASLVVRPDAATVVTTLSFWSGDAFRSVAPGVQAGIWAVVPGAGADDWQRIVANAGLHCDGSVVIRGLWPGMNVDIVMQAGDLFIDGRLDTVSPSSGMNFTGMLHLPSFMFAGNVHRAGGPPVSGANVELWTDPGAGGPPDSWPWAKATTRDDGEFGNFWDDDGVFHAQPWLPWDSGEMILRVYGSGFDGFFQDLGGGAGVLVPDPGSATPLSDDGFDREPYYVDIEVPTSP